MLFPAPDENHIMAESQIKKRFRVTAAAVILIICAALHAAAKTEITSSGYGNLTDLGIQETVAEFESLCADYGPAMANAYALANLGGYAVGDSNLGGPGRLFLSAGVTGGMSNMRFFDDQYESEQGEYPAFAVNPAVSFGIGLSSNLDLIGKAFAFSTGMYRPPVDRDEVKLESFNIYSFGGRLRYAAVKRKTFLPGIFNFGGLTFSAGGDVMYGNIKFSGQYTYSYTAHVDAAGSEVALPLNFESTYSAYFKWFLTSISAQTLVYGEFLGIFNAYTGFGLAFSYGGLNLELNAEGDVVTTSGEFLSVTNNPVDSIQGLSTHRYSPGIIKPYYILGIELDAIVVRIVFESAVDLTNGSDINAQLSVRAQI